MSLRMSRQKRYELAGYVASRVTKRIHPKPVPAKMRTDMPSTESLWRMIENTTEYSFTTHRPKTMEMEQRLRVSAPTIPSVKTITLPKPIPKIKQGNVVINEDWVLKPGTYWTDNLMLLEARSGGAYNPQTDNGWQQRVWKKEREIKKLVQTKIEGCNTLNQLIDTYPGCQRYECVKKWKQDAIDAAERRKQNQKPRERIDSIDRSCIAKARLLGAKL